jgi:hypothetical protein
MANEGHIIVKSGSEKPRQNSGRWGSRQFFRDVDKGSSRPAFCYPRRAEGLKEELHQMERNIKEHRVDPERAMGYELKAKKIKERVELFDESFENSKSIIDKAPDSW